MAILKLPNSNKIFCLFNFLEELISKSPKVNFASDYTARCGNSVLLNGHPNSDGYVEGKIINELSLETKNAVTHRHISICVMSDINGLFSFIYSFETKKSIMRTATGEIFEIDDCYYYPPQYINGRVSMDTRKEFESIYDFVYTTNIPVIKAWKTPESDVDELVNLLESDAKERKFEVIINDGVYRPNDAEEKKR